MNFRILFVSFIVLLLALTPVSVSKNLSISELDNNLIESLSSANWTIMYYMAGDVRGMDVWTYPLIENLTKIKSTSDINIVVLNDDFKKEHLDIFYIDFNGEKIYIHQDFGWPDEVDTSNLNTLELFCKQMMNTFPAKHYCLIPIASGGTGWQLLCLHDADDGRIGVSIPAFANTLKNIYEDTKHKIDVIFTSCAMNMIEVVYEFSPYVNYIVGTQTCLSKQYLVQRFYESVWDLKNDTSLTPEEFALKAPEKLTPLSFYYDESYNGKLPLLNQILLKFPFKAFHPVLYKESSAVVNLSNIEKLTNSINNLSQFLILNDYNDDINKAIAKAWKDTRKLGECLANNKLLMIIHGRWHFNITSSTRFIDVYHFMLNLKNHSENLHLKSLCNSFMNNLNNTISAIKRVDGDNQYGLSIYFPPTRHSYNKYPIFEKLPATYEELKFAQDTNWDEFLKTYLNN